MDRYASVARAVTMSGPTSFAPLIRKAIEIVYDSEREYHCLVIIADGQVSTVQQSLQQCLSVEFRFKPAGITPHQV